MNDLIDRYLGAVAALLPKAQRQDIIAELRDLIINRVEEQEAVWAVRSTRKRRRRCCATSAIRSPWRAAMARTAP
jgi:hypothetical protein